MARVRATPTDCKRTVSGSVSLSCSECFSPFPRGTGPLSVSQEYLALPDGPGKFTQDCSCPVLLRITARGINHYVYRTITSFGLPFQYSSTYDIQPLSGSPSTPIMPKHYWFRLFPVRSPLLRESLLLSFPPVTEMFQFSGFASPAYGGRRSAFS